ncbi:MAG: HAMP domain-containing histidine kinase [Rhodocyclaceae bacterium]|nr:HAMP domain-containing histidine kinase [Rhodocyclaceae bacterium]MBP6279660.1 HAMP domain-containing histidine kinase [Rhodocyclaceae bacterium]
MPTTPLSERLINRLPSWRGGILIAMLAVLFLVLSQPMESVIVRPLFLGHLGLFILWQPLIKGHQRLSIPILALLIALAVVAAFQINGWLLMLWILMLAGIVGGKVLLLGAPVTRLFHLFALGFLVLALLVLATPLALPEAKLPSAIVTAVRVVLPLALLIMIALPKVSESAHQTEVIDFVNSLFVFLLLAVLVLGSLSMMLLSNTDYATALLKSLVALSAVLLILGWTWSPHAGFSGWGNFFSRYLLSIGLPAEQWLHSLANLAEEDLSPDAFVARACAAMTDGLPWVSGINWSAAGVVGAFGEQRGESAQFSHQQVVLTLFTRYPLPPSLIWHFNLLAQLLGEFHADKQRAQRLKEMSYMQAVHETGARLTHDVKNLLQSLQMLCHAANEPGSEDSSAFRALLQRQLPTITTRLEVTLDKLRVRQASVADPLVPLNLWWAELVRRFEGKTWISFTSATASSSLEVPATLFTSVLDNLLSNMAAKRQREPNLTVSIHVEPAPSGIAILVSDSGSAIEKSIQPQLLRGPVRSEDGLGIGLYQVARQAESLGYRLALVESRDGCVCFELAPIVTIVTDGD